MNVGRKSSPFQTLKLRREVILEINLDPDIRLIRFEIPSPTSSETVRPGMCVPGRDLICHYIDAVLLMWQAPGPPLISVDSFGISLLLNRSETGRVILLS